MITITPRTRPAGARQNSADFKSFAENKLVGVRELEEVIGMLSLSWILKIFLHLWRCENASPTNL